MGSKVGNTSYKQKFRKEWMEDVQLKPWLREVPGEPSKAKCSVCKVVLTAKLEDLKDHGGTQKHKIAAAPLMPGSSQGTIPFAPEKPKPSAPLQTLIAIAALSLFVVCHAAVRTVDHLTDLCKRIYSGVHSITSNLKLHRTKCSAIIRNVMSPFFCRKLRGDIGDGFFSLLLDESTDISVHKHLGICIRYFSLTEKRIVDTFLSLVTLKAADAPSIVKAVKRCLKRFNLPLCKLRGIGTDNASVMTGTSFTNVKHYTYIYSE